MGYFNRMEWLRLNGLLNGDFYGVCADFYGLFTAFVPTFTDFYQVYRLLSSFLTLNMFFVLVQIYRVLRIFIAMHQNLRVFLYRLPVNRLP